MQTSPRWCGPLPTAPALPLPESPLLHHPRRRFVAFSAVGVLMVCLPLWQVLRYQQSDLQQLAVERALLDPVARAVQVQFGLLAHRTVAAQLLQGRLLQGRVLQGHSQLEPARHAVQVGVDTQLQTLAQELAQGLWAHAGAETRDLTRDWQALAQRVKAHALSAAQSNEAHSLCVEQAVQVVDLVTMADGVSGGTAPSSHLPGGAFASVARNISRLAAELPAPAIDGGPQAALAAGDPLAASTHLQRRMLAVRQALAAAAPAATPVATLQPALADVERSAQAVMQAAHSPAGASPAAVQAAQRSQVAFFEQALDEHKRALAQRQTTVQQHQLALLVALALLTTTALALLGSLWRRMKPAPAVAPLSSAGSAQQWSVVGPGQQLAAATDATATSTKAEAQRVLDRLRTNRPTRTTDPQPAPREPHDTRPPERS